jgi:hypothetical protein
MRYRPRFGSARREGVWYGACIAAYLGGNGANPICNLCGLPVFETDDWDESHDPGRAKVFGGKVTGVAHRRCNREHGAKVVTPAKAKSDRVRRRHAGELGPGRGKRLLPGGRRSSISKTFNRGVQPRLTGAEKHALMMAAREIAVRSELPG